eukprot:TRINITY_DN3817_c0_g1_i1.p1 TRINITY_DN3817_c0_g1~~TRINITY_DN3817_c0_g1_i1.p1  ORF type:complete len:281 (-),score=49.25 TRINITY_DN3817_c0_g1_i1:26-826(-)
MSDLDSVLNSFSKNLEKAVEGGPTERGVCSHCHLSIYGNMIEVGARRYHPDHFVCKMCSRGIVGNYYEVSGQNICQSCHLKNKERMCASCNQTIVGNATTALGKMWHPHHFNCTTCGEPMKEGSFYEHEGRPFCLRDFKSVKSSTISCGLCLLPITGKVVNAAGRKFCEKCFVCAQKGCGVSLAGQSFHEAHNSFYCPPHFTANNGLMCGGCGGELKGQYAVALGRNWHPSCFSCSGGCGKEMAGQSFVQNNGKPYCVSCDRRLFP